MGEKGMENKLLGRENCVCPGQKSVHTVRI